MLKQRKFAWLPMQVAVILKHLKEKRIIRLPSCSLFGNFYSRLLRITMSGPLPFLVV